MAYESTTVTLTCMNSYDNIVCLFQWVQQQLLYTNGSLGLLLTFYGDLQAVTKLKNISL
jgi:hypothetical protein